MDESCPICTHPKRPTLEAEVTRRGPRRDIPGRYGVTMAVLRSHVTECMASPRSEPARSVDRVEPLGDGTYRHTTTYTWPFPKTPPEVSYDVNPLTTPSTDLIDVANPLVTYWQKQLEPTRRKLTPSDVESTDANPPCAPLDDGSQAPARQQPSATNPFQVTYHDPLTPDERARHMARLKGMERWVPTETDDQRALVRQFRRAFEAMDRRHQQQELEWLRHHPLICGWWSSDG